MAHRMSLSLDLGGMFFSGHNWRGTGSGLRVTKSVVGHDTRWRSKGQMDKVVYFIYSITTHVRNTKGRMIGSSPDRLRLSSSVRASMWTNS